jgi:hypothetical protein
MSSKSWGRSRKAKWVVWEFTTAGLESTLASSRSSSWSKHSHAEIVEDVIKDPALDREFIGAYTAGMKLPIKCGG